MVLAYYFPLYQDIKIIRTYLIYYAVLTLKKIDFFYLKYILPILIISKSGSEI